MNPEKRNILFLSSWYPSKTISTLGNFVQRHAEAVATKHSVHVLYISPLSGLNDTFSIEDHLIQGVKSTIVYYKPGKINQWRAFKKGVDHLQKKGEFHFDLIHHNVIWNAGWQAWWISWKFKIPFVITEHWTGYNLRIQKQRSKWVGPFSRFIASRASMICPVTFDLQRSMQQFGLAGSYAVVPNVVDTKIFHPGEKDNSVIRFLHVSTLNDEHKNISGILRVWKEVSSISPNILLAIGGDGPYQVYRSMAIEMGISQTSISFFGEKKSEDIAEMMEKHHCLLMFSNYENLPCVIVEAMASGMGIISTDVGGISEHVDEAKGILVPCGDEEALKNAILQYAQNSTKYSPVKLREYADQHFSVDSIASKFSEVYSKVLSGK